MLRRLIRKIRGLVALIALSAGAMEAATVGASEPMAWRFAHPEAQVLAGVDFRRLAETADGKQIRAQFAAALGGPLLDQTERLLMSSVVDSGGKRSDVLILSGSFSLAQLRKMAMQEGAKMVPYKGLEIAAPSGAKAGDPHLAWITGPGGGTTVLIGTRPAIQAAAERSKAHVESLASVNPLFARGRDLTAEYPIWVSCDSVPQGFGPKSFDQFAESDQVDLGQLEGFDVGVAVAKDPGVHMWVWTTNEATSGEALKRLQASSNGKERFVLSTWLSDLKGGLDGNAMVMAAPLVTGKMASRVGPLLAAFALPVDVKPEPVLAEPALVVRAKVESNVPVSGVAMTGVAKSAPGPVPVPPAVAVARPEPPKKMFVRIEGLDDGMKDIPYTAKPQ